MNEEDEAQSPEVLNEIPTVISIKPPNSTSDRPNLFPTQVSSSMPLEADFCREDFDM